MNSSFDLNINNYSQIELEELLELPNNYDTTILDIQENKLRQNIIDDKTINSNTKNETLKFISQIKDILLNNAKKMDYRLKNYEDNLDTIYNIDKSLKNVEINDKYIIDKPNKPYTKSLPGEFYSGTINPLNNRTVLKKFLNIDTKFRDNYYSTLSTNFYIDLPIKLSQVVTMQLSSLEYPSSFYGISKIFGNNFFVIRVMDLELMVIIPDGNYDFLGLQNYINSYLASAGAPWNTINFFVDINSNASVTPNGSGKMVVGSTTGTLAFELDFQTDETGNIDRQTPLPLKFGWLIGFREGYYENSFTYISEGLVDLLGPKYVYLAVDDYNNNVNNSFYSAFTSSILNKNILARISVQGQVFDVISQNNLSIITSPRQYFGPVDIQKLHIQLLDEYGRILNLNNMDYSFCLTFQTIYDLT